MIEITSMSDMSDISVIDPEICMIDIEDDKLSSMHVSYSDDASAYNDTNTYHIISEKALSILLHIFIMVSFIIYFYFNYVIIIEKKLFTQKIKEYFYTINKHYDEDFDDSYKLLLKDIIVEYPKPEEELYDAYKDAEEDQEELLNYLLHKSLIMMFIVFMFLLIAFINCLCIRDKIRWKSIIVENILMFVLLGAFEYIFFNTIILKYSPITNEELRYSIYSNMRKIVDGTY